jgi:rhamnosyltransferase
MATYNGKPYIEEQLDSIINQSYKNWILIIRDDNSKDNTIAKIKHSKPNKNKFSFLVLSSMINSFIICCF